jgi:hypothetical protein
VTAAAVIALLNLSTAYRVVRYRGRRADHLTYLLLCWWLIAGTALAGFVLRR